MLGYVCQHRTVTILILWADSGFSPSTSSNLSTYVKVIDISRQVQDEETGTQTQDPSCKVSDTESQDSDRKESDFLDLRKYNEFFPDTEPKALDSEESDLGDFCSQSLETEKSVRLPTRKSRAFNSFMILEEIREKLNPWGSSSDLRIEKKITIL
ncbi:hypothetical protein NPIL_149001 [Nephila pilipes]|uniref:Uncharacterized protein n=1 Tax=Nephila pilipes TaxID=299642 RepID=A0A8X6QLM8_NEPPI|nr:hypothetical protein NPIL_149001 [Nephila pilipes]